MAGTKEAPKGAWMFVYVVAGLVAVMAVVSAFQFQKSRRCEDRWRRAEKALADAESSQAALKRLKHSGAAKRSTRLSDLSWFASEARRVDPSLPLNVNTHSEVLRQNKEYQKVYAVTKVRQASYNKILDLLFKLDQRVAEWGLRCSKFDIGTTRDGQWRLNEAEFAAYVYKPQSANP